MSTSRPLSFTIALCAGLAPAMLLAGPQASRPVAPRGGHDHQAGLRPDAGAESRPITRPARTITPRADTPAAKGTAGSFYKTIGSLALVVVLIVAAGRLLRKHGPTLARGLPAEAVEVLGRRHIDQKQSIHLVRLGSRILVIGSSPGGLQTLAELTDPVEVDSLAGLCRQTSEEAGVTQSFLSMFTRHTAEAAGAGARQRGDSSPAAVENDAARGPAEERLARKLMQSASRPQPNLEEAHA